MSATSKALVKLDARTRRLRRLSRRFPALRPLVDKAGFAVWKYQLRRNAPDLPGGLGTLLWTDPRDITTAVWRLDLLAELGKTSQRDLVGVVADGDWDRTAFPLHQLSFFSAVNEHFNDGVEWDDTAFFCEVRESLGRGKPMFKYRTVADIEPQRRRIEALYVSMGQHGFLSQHELGTQRPWDEIVIAIDRNGHLMFVNGRHRLAVALALGIERIPVLVGVRHREWATKRAEIAAYIQSTGGISYQPLVHPDLAFIPSRSGDDRLPLFLPALPSPPAVVADIGANKGFMCHMLEQRGYQCIAIERSDREAYFLQMIRDACDRSFEIQHLAVQDFSWDRQIDAVLALNVFHHFLKTEQAHQELRNLLSRIDASVMIFESHLQDDPQMANAYQNYAPDEFVAFILENSGFSRVESLGAADDSRPLFRLSHN